MSITIMRAAEGSTDKEGNGYGAKVEQGVMIDHTSISVKDLETSLAFYDVTLTELGYKQLANIDITTPKGPVRTVGYAMPGKPAFWISPLGNKDEEVGKARGMHIAFRVSSAEAIDKWYAKVLEFGGKDNGKPGPRPYYHPGYYGAFVIDPNGWRLEACFHSYEVKKDGD